MYRITNSMLAANYLTNMGRNLRNMQTIQSQLASGKEIRRPSDDPYKASRTMQLYTEIDANKQFNENIKDVSNWLDTTDTALDQSGKVFLRVKELLVSAGNSSYGPNERKAVQDEIKQKVHELSQILNTNFDGAYIFGGTKSTSKPVMVDSSGMIQYADKEGNSVVKTATGFTGNLTNPIASSVPASTKSIVSISKDATTGVVQVTVNDSSAVPPTSSVTIGATASQTDFQTNLSAAGFTTGDADKAFAEYSSINRATDQIGSGLNVEVSQGVLINYNKTAVDILEYKDKTGASKKVSDVLNDIITNLGAGGDLSKVTGEDLTQVDAIIQNILQKRSEVGAMTNRMESAQSKNEDENLNMTDILSKTEDIDFTETMMQYSTMQTIYMAALQTSGKILPATLLDYIR